MAELFVALQSALADRYTIERELGSGGMATVYLAEDLKYHRRVAIKVLRPELAAALGPERFLREIEIVASLQHPHLLTLIESGSDQGFLFYTMPYVEGESLRDRLNREHQLPLEDAILITREVADALGYSHGRGVLHRDIKPENILLTGGHAIVADFGIARAVSVAGGERLTQTGISIGTPAYMSPEQATGSGQLDGRTDIYSLGCVLYEMLAGDPPFTGSTAQAIVARHVVDPPPRLRTVRHTVSPALEAVVQRALEKVPADRFQTAAQFAAAIETAGLAPQREFPRWRVRAVAFAGMLFAGLGSLWAIRHLRSGPTSVRESVPTTLDPRHIAVLYFADSSDGGGLRYLADGLTEGLINDLRRVPSIEVISRNGVDRYRSSNASLDSIIHALQVGTLVTGELGRSGTLVRLTVTVIDGTTGHRVGGGTLEHSLDDVFGLQSALLAEVALDLQPRLGLIAQPAELQPETRNARAWELVARAKMAKQNVDSLLSVADTAGAARALAIADSLLAKSASLDRKWIVPVVERGWIAYEERKIVGWEKGPAWNWTRRALGFADQALRVRPNPEAYRLRGTILYIRSLLDLDPAPLTPGQLLDSAAADLRAGADSSNPNAASAWSLLSHLYGRISDPAQGNLSAQRAMEADPYLTDANDLLFRAFSSSLDREDSAGAHHWCMEGRRRYPKDPYFTECQFELMGLPGQPVEVRRAWELLEEDVGLWPPAARVLRRRRDQILIGFALVNAGLKDSAERLALRSRADSAIDPNRELLYFEAALRNRLGDRDESLRLLGLYLAANPQDRISLAADRSWWWQGVREDPRFRQLVSAR